MQLLVFCDGGSGSSDTYDRVEFNYGWSNECSESSVNVGNTENGVIIKHTRKSEKLH